MYLAYLSRDETNYICHGELFFIFFFYIYLFGNKGQGHHHRKIYKISCKTQNKSRYFSLMPPFSFFFQTALDIPMA